MKKMPQKLVSRGFTLVELLIVIALIAILSVAVLATINPIEQSNKAKDSTVQNDAAEVLNAYERQYANSQTYPWMGQGDALAVETAVTVFSDQVGFGICGLGAGATGATFDADASCDTATTTTPGLLISGDELKPSFAGKAEFSTATANPENGLWTIKTNGSGGGIYVCYIPKAKSNRQIAAKMYCITNTGALCKIGATCGANPCLVKDVASTGWDTPVVDGTSAMFRCVPE